MLSKRKTTKLVPEYLYRLASSTYEVTSGSLVVQVDAPCSRQRNKIPGNAEQGVFYVLEKNVMAKHFGNEILQGAKVLDISSVLQFVV